MSASDKALWGSDVPVSTPVLRPDAEEILKVSFDGLAFTPAGMTFDLSAADFDATYLPQWTPEDPR